MKAAKPPPRSDAQREARRKGMRRLRASLNNDVPDELIRALVCVRPLLAQEKARTVQGFAYLAWCSLMEHRRHKELPEYCSFDFRELDARFSGKFAELNAVHQLFEVVPAARRGLTNAYRLLPDVSDSIRNTIRDGNRSRTRVAMVMASGKQRRSLPSAIARDSLHQTGTKWRADDVVSLLPVDRGSLERLERRLYEIALLPLAWQHTELEALGQDGKLSAHQLISIVQNLISMTRTTLGGDGIIVHLYTQGSTGRLFAEGMNVQSAPRMVKTAALNGLWAYDFENCHFTIVAQLFQRLRAVDPTLAELTALAAYLAAKEETRLVIADECGLTPKEVKLCLIRLGYGAKFFLRKREHLGLKNEQDSITELIGEVRSRLFFGHPLVRRVQADLQRARKAILASWPREHGALVNDMDLRYSPKKARAEGGKDTAATRFAHILQGIEARMLHITVGLYRDDIVLLEHDGWTAKRPLDVERIKSRIATELGFDMQLEEKLVVARC